MTDSTTTHSIRRAAQFTLMGALGVVMMTAGCRPGPGSSRTQSLAQDREAALVASRDAELNTPDIIIGDTADRDEAVESISETMNEAADGAVNDAVASDAVQDLDADIAAVPAQGLSASQPLPPEGLPEAMDWSFNDETGEWVAIEPETLRNDTLADANTNADADASPLPEWVLGGDRENWGVVPVRPDASGVDAFADRFHGLNVNLETLPNVIEEPTLAEQAEAALPSED